MQTIAIAGRLGRDAEVRTTQAGDSVCSFNVAVDYRNGREKATNWWRVSLWGKRGAALGPHLTKGTTVSVSGEFSLSEYEGKSQLNVRANEVTLLGGGGEGRKQANGSQGGKDDSWGSAGGSNDGWGDDSSDIPFITNRSIY